MLYLLYCRDREDAAGVRAATRADHLAWVGSVTAVAVRVAGPILSDDGESMIGSVFLVEADDLDAVRAFNADDPYTKAGLFGEVEIHPFRYLAGDGALPKG